LFADGVSRILFSCKCSLRHTISGALGGFLG
jgi:hypothetical protein